MIYIGERLKKLRTDRNLTQKQVAELFGVTISTISLYESDIRKPSYDVLIKYAAYFHVSTDYILMDSKKIYYDVTDLSDEDRQEVKILITHFRDRRR